VPSVHSVFLSVYGPVDARSLPGATPMFPRFPPDRNRPIRAEDRPKNGLENRKG
jgi:hypothetical protein